MSNVAKLKKEAADLEQKKQFDKALKVYARLFAEFEKSPQDVDVSLYNRVGDIQVKLGQVAEAVDTYEKGVDYYAEGGFFNNAIALGNKILRQAPGRASIYYKLGRINAQKGFKAEARQNFLEYADRVEKSGNTSEAFRALIEFMDLVPDQDDIRSMLADQLIKADRKADAIGQLRHLYERHVAEGRVADADATAAKVQALDPSVDLSSITVDSASEASSDDLIFIDLDAPPRATPAPPPRQAPPPKAAAAAPPPAAPAVQPPPAPAPRPPVAAAPVAPPPPPPAPEPEPEFEITRASDQKADLSSADAGMSLDIEPTSLGGDSSPGISSGGLDIEPTSFGEVSLDSVPSFEMPAPPPPAPPARPAPAAPVSEPVAEDEHPIIEDLSFDIPGMASAAPVMEERKAEEIPLLEVPDDEEPEEADDEPVMLDLGALPDKAIAPVIHDAHSAPAIEMPDVEPIDAEVEEPEPVATPPKKVPSPPAMKSSPAAARPAPPPAPAAPKEPAARHVNPFQTAASGKASKGAPAEPPDAPTKAPAAQAPVVKPPVAIPDVATELLDADMPRKSMVFAAKAVNILQAAVSGAPEDWSLRRELAEAMLEAGDRSGGLHELEVAMNGAENSDDLELAMALAEELGKLEPLVVKHHQKRVEYAFRRNDKPRLVDAYLTLGDALMQNTQLEKARAVYQRVLELAPDNMQAQAAVETLAPQTPAPPAAPAKRSSAMSSRPAARNSSADAAPSDSDGFVNLGDWLREDEGPKDTRMVVEEQDPTGDEDADFADMLKKFKQGVAENVDAEDYQSHYDLAIAFKEMGLLDEAIAGFQRALGSKQNRLPTYEALGECFLEKGQAKMAGAILNRAVGEGGASDDQLVGVLYLLGRAYEEQGDVTRALDYYQRVFVIDIQFKDVADRMSALDQAAR